VFFLLGKITRCAQTFFSRQKEHPTPEPAELLYYTNNRDYFGVVLFERYIPTAGHATHLEGCTQ
jgi:hypothetical protein